MENANSQDILDKIVIQNLAKDTDYKTYCQLLKQLTTMDPESVQCSMFQKTFELIHSNPRHQILVAKYGDKIVGSITILIEPKFIHNISSVAHIEDVVVDESVRGKGIGSLLVQEAIKLARSNGCYKTILDCCPENVPFYSKMGFETKGVQMAIYFDKD